MSMAVIDFFEAVEIHENQGKGFARFDPARAVTVQAGPIFEPREAVYIHDILEFVDAAL